ncbi:MAG TPA: GNAT family N-acetyltransferase [Candidatus Saccharimonadales bacterium]|nr:GNAT family N-acetyltransferase [Candidatus Saccharimonadales bacterium]
MTFREITIADYEKLIPFWKEHYFFNEMDSKDRFQLFLEKNAGLSFLAEENDEIVGTVLGSFDGRRGYLQKLVVDKAKRKHGVGKKLVEQVLEKLKTLRCTYIPLAVEKELVYFYQTCGFEITKQVPMNIEIK